MASEELSDEVKELIKSANRQRLTRAGLLKIMRENEAREAIVQKDEDKIG